LLPPTSLVRANGGTVRCKGLTVEKKRTILDLDSMGVGQGEIARRIQRSQSVVWHFLNGQWPNLNT
jgi:Helix-turn-helix domain